MRGSMIFSVRFFPALALLFLGTITRLTMLSMDPPVSSAAARWFQLALLPGSLLQHGPDVSIMVNVAVAGLLGYLISEFNKA